MNALEAASLVMIPSGYENGTLGSLKPTDGTGDFTFSRGSDISATRVNEDGLIEKGYENLLYPSNDFSGWFNINSILTPNQAGYDGSNDAWLLEATIAQGRRYRSISDTGVLTYSLYAKSGTADILRLRIDAATDMDLRVDLSDGSFISGTFIDYKIEDAGNGWWRVSVTQNITSPVFIFVYSYDAGSIYIQDAMINQGLVAYPYVETTTAPVAGGILEDMPRLNGSCPSLLLEPQRTNLITSSEYFGAGWQANQTTITSNTHLSPEGLQNASSIADTSTSSVQEIQYRYTPVAGASYTLSLFIKKDTNTTRFPEFFFRNYNGGTAQEIVVRLNTQTGEKYNRVLNGTSPESSVIDFNEDYWRLVMSLKDPNDGNDQLRFYLRPAASTTIDGAYNNLVTGSIVAYGLQLEQDATYPTSYIPTYGTSQTRLKDVVIGAGDVNTFNSTEGVLYAEFNALADDRGDSGYFQISDGTGSNRFYIGNSGAVNSKMSSVAVIGGALQWNISSSSNFDVTQFHKVAVSYKENDITLYVDGQIQGTDTSAVMAPANTFNVLDFRAGLTTHRYGEVKQVLYFPTALSDDECIELTTI